MVNVSAADISDLIFRAILGQNLGRFGPLRAKLE